MPGRNTRFHGKALDLAGCCFREFVFPDGELAHPLIIRQAVACFLNFHSQQCLDIGLTHRAVAINSALRINRFLFREDNGVNLLRRADAMAVHHNFRDVWTFEQFVFHLFRIDILAVGSDDQVFYPATDG